MKPLVHSFGRGHCNPLVAGRQELFELPFSVFMPTQSQGGPFRAQNTVDIGVPLHDPLQPGGDAVVLFETFLDQHVVGNHGDDLICAGNGRGR